MKELQPPKEPSREQPRNFSLAVNQLFVNVGEAPRTRVGKRKVRTTVECQIPGSAGETITQRPQSPACPANHILTSAAPTRQVTAPRLPITRTRPSRNKAASDEIATNRCHWHAEQGCNMGTERMPAPARCAVRSKRPMKHPKTSTKAPNRQKP